MPDQPVAPDQPTSEPSAAAKNPSAAFLPIGLVFLVLGLSGLANDSMRGTSYAFIPVGITFLILSIQGGKKAGDDGATAPPGPDSPVTPHVPTAVGDGPRADDRPGPDVTPR
jgi:hypothetical protein